MFKTTVKNPAAQNAEMSAKTPAAHDVVAVWDASIAHHAVMQSTGQNAKSVIVTCCGGNGAVD